jgi:hypothetical protein
LGLPPAAAHGQQPLERQQPHDETTMTIDTWGQDSRRRTKGTLGMSLALLISIEI